MWLSCPISACTHTIDRLQQISMPADSVESTATWCVETTAMLFCLVGIGCGRSAPEAALWLRTRARAASSIASAMQKKACRSSASLRHQRIRVHAHTCLGSTGQLRRLRVVRPAVTGWVCITCIALPGAQAGDPGSPAAACAPPAAPRCTRPSNMHAKHRHVGARRRIYESVHGDSITQRQGAPLHSA